MQILKLFGLILCVIWVSDIKASQISFRETLEADIPTLNVLMRRSKEVAGKSRYTKEYLDDFMDKLSFTTEVFKLSRSTILLVDEKIAGFYSFYINKDNQLELDNFFLDPAFLYKGYGKILWNDCIKLAAKEYSKKSYFIIWSSLEAESFYQKRGCVKIGDKPSPADSKLVQPVLQYNLHRSG